MENLLLKFKQKGALFVEYALILSFVIITGVVFLSDGIVSESIATIFDKTAQMLGIAADDVKTERPILLTTLFIGNGSWQWDKAGFGSSAKMLHTYYGDDETNLDRKGLYKLDANTEYEVSVTFDRYEKNGFLFMANAIQLYNADGNKTTNYFDSGTPPYSTTEATKSGDTHSGKNPAADMNYKYTENSDGTITYTATFKTNDKESYFGMNFGVRSTSNAPGVVQDFSKVGITDTQKEQLKEQITNTMTLTKKE